MEKKGMIKLIKLDEIMVKGYVSLIVSRRANKEEGKHIQKWSELETE